MEWPGNPPGKKLPAAERFPPETLPSGDTRSPMPQALSIEQPAKREDGRCPEPIGTFIVSLFIDEFKTAEMSRNLQQDLKEDT
ncbi:MAG: hypothetical protein ACE14T_05605 [Syntrophales bacterium]